MLVLLCSGRLLLVLHSLVADRTDQGELLSGEGQQHGESF